MTASWFIVIVPVLSTQSTSIVAASSAALRRVTSTPRLASSFDPTAMLTVNMTGRATGTALISRTSMSGIISRSGAPRISDSTTTTPSSAPTMTKSQRTTLATTASMWSFGTRLLHEFRGAAKIGLRPGQHHHAVAFAPADDGPRREHFAGRLVRVLRFAGERRLIDAQALR